MIKKRGFTLVELVVVLVAISILISISVIGIVRYQEDGRDSRRNANVTTIAEALEKYFDAKGEYPSCAAMTASVDTVVSSTLKGVDRTAFVAPGAETSVTNSVRCGQTLTINGEDFFEYSGGGGANCTGAVACTTFTLKYRNEGDDTIKSVTSRRTAV